MPVGEEFSNTLLVKVNGTALPADVKALLVTGWVDQAVHVPDLCELRFRDPEAIVLEKGKLEIGAALEVSVQDTAPGGPEALFVGEVTAIEAEIGEAGVHTVVRGLDKAHRLHRGAHVEAYVNMSASDIAARIAQRAGVTLQADPTSVVLEHTTQAAESDWAFLSRLATEHDRRLTLRAGKLYFVKRPQAAQAPSSTKARTEPLVLQQGINLLDLRATITASVRADAIEVRGWDPKAKRSVVGNAKIATSSAAPGSMTPQRAASQLQRGTAPYLVADARLANASLAQQTATSLADHVGGGFAELEGVAVGNPALGAGTAVKLAGIGVKFEGQYVLTSTRHDLRHEHGYRTHFTASNASDRSLLGVVQGAPEPGPRISGVVSALVTNNKDPDELGRVKVKIPWLSEDYESGWCRTLQLGAGGKRGLVVLPEVNDEVLVSFTHGDVGHPYVLGGVFNGKDKPKEGWAPYAGRQGRIERWAWTSRTGMSIAFVDKAGEEALEISTNNGAQKVTLLQGRKGIQILSEGPVEVTAKQDVTVEAQQGATVKATGPVKVEGQKVDVTGQAGVTLKGALVNVEATGVLTLKGSIVRIN